MLERFTDPARWVVVLAQEEARLLGHPGVGPEHLLLSLLAVTDGTAARSLSDLGLTLDRLREAVREAAEAVFGDLPSHSLPFTEGAKRALEAALTESVQLRDGYIGTGHLLLGIVDGDDPVTSEVLLGQGIVLFDVRQTVLRLLAEERRTGTEEMTVSAGKQFARRLERADHMGLAVNSALLALSLPGPWPTKNMAPTQPFEPLDIDVYDNHAVVLGYGAPPESEPPGLQNFSFVHTDGAWRPLGGGSGGSWGSPFTSRATTPWDDQPFRIVSGGHHRAGRSGAFISHVVLLVAPDVTHVVIKRGQGDRNADLAGGPGFLCALWSEGEAPTLMFLDAADGPKGSLGPEQLAASLTPRIPRPPRRLPWSLGRRHRSSTRVSDQPPKEGQL